MNFSVNSYGFLPFVQSPFQVREAAAQETMPLQGAEKEEVETGGRRQASAPEVIGACVFQTCPYAGYVTGCITGFLPIHFSDSSAYFSPEGHSFRDQPVPLIHSGRERVHGNAVAVRGLGFMANGTSGGCRAIRVSAVPGSSFAGGSENNRGVRFFSENLKAACGAKIVANFFKLI